MKLGDWNARGGEIYAKVFDSWARELKQLPRVEASVERCTATDAGELVARWRVTWTPASLLWLESLGEAMGWELDRRDVLDNISKVSQFSWRALFKLLGTAYATGKLRVPIAAVTGATRVAVRGDDSAVTSVRASIDQVDALLSGRLRNRRIGRDLQAFLDVLWVSGVGMEQLEPLDFSNVPGMGQFDIDGLDAQQRGQAIEDVSAFLFVATAAVLVFGVGVAGLYLQHLSQERALNEILASGM
ncbi:unnamed protein product [Pedinophyceae sp. YPF-701]|nr:unnamed protein product [Pedinophyceae sp. YPF-701]